MIRSIYQCNFYANVVWQE